MTKNTRLEIHQPQANQTLHAANYQKAGHNVLLIAVAGKAWEIHHLVATLVEQAPKGTAPKVYTGVIAKCGRSWAISFFDIPPGDFPGNKAKRFHLTVGQVGALQGAGNLAATVEFTLDPNSLRGHYGNIPIQYPLADSTVCPTFVAYGSDASGLTTTHATMTWGSTSIDGVKLSSPTGTWMFQFTNLPDNDYVFAVDNASAGADTGENDGVTVDAAACAPAPAPPAPAPPPPPQP